MIKVVIVLLSTHFVQNNSFEHCDGLNVTVKQMSIDIKGASFYREKTPFEPKIELVVPDTTIEFQVLDVNRSVRICLVNDITAPIAATEEIGKTNNEIQDILMCIASFNIPAYCDDLSTVSMQIWEFTDAEVGRNEYEPAPAKSPEIE